MIRVWLWIPVEHAAQSSRELGSRELVAHWTWIALGSLQMPANWQREGRSGTLRFKCLNATCSKLSGREREREREGERERERERERELYLSRTSIIMMTEYLSVCARTHATLIRAIFPTLRKDRPKCPLIPYFCIMPVCVHNTHTHTLTHTHTHTHTHA